VVAAHILLVDRFDEDCDAMRRRQSAGEIQVLAVSGIGPFGFARSASHDVNGPAANVGSISDRLLNGGARLAFSARHRAEAEFSGITIPRPGIERQHWQRRLLESSGYIGRLQHRTENGIPRHRNQRTFAASIASGRGRSRQRNPRFADSFIASASPRACLA
jgi:hypothetical protein